jgi:acyl carrier protein
MLYRVRLHEPFDEVKMSGVEQRVLKVFIDVLEIKENIDTARLKYNETLNWNSLAHITLVSALEGEFDIMLDPDDILAMSSYDKAVDIVRKASNAN